jgi:uncharacterized membrane protein YfcA
MLGQTHTPMVNLDKVFGFTKREIWAVVLLLALAASFRVVVAHRWPNDAPDDGRAYAQMARNILEQHVYSHAMEPPYDPSLIRLPGYPLFLAAVYSVFGHTNNGAVRIVQALIDAATCLLIAALAFYWEPDEQRKRAAAIAALALAAVCPFTTIYAATILTEVPTNFLLMAMFLAATLAFRRTFTTEDTEEFQEGNKRFGSSLLWWFIAGLLGGLAVFLRPDTGLFAAAVGFTLVITTIWSAARHRFGSAMKPSQVEEHPKLLRRFALPAHSRTIFARMLLSGAIFSLAFTLVLVPWTIRNWRVFHMFQPLSPAHGEMPGEFVARGYNLWLRTWLDKDSYIDTFEWSLDVDQIDIEDVPAYAFDSAEEKQRVEELLEKYNHPASSQTATTDEQESTPVENPQPSPAQTPQTSKDIQPKNNTNSNTDNQADETSDENDQSDSGDQADEGDNQSSSEETKGPVAMTPEIDAVFGQIARERIARHPFQFYVWVPIKRARTMWIDTHAQYWPFEGTLLPLADLDHTHRQHIWLPLFAGLSAVYTVLGLAGGLLLCWSRKRGARRWFLLAGLAIFLRLALFSSLENPEPRYLVEFFPFLSILGGIAIARFKPRMNADSRG